MSSKPFNTPLALTIKPSFQKWLIVLAPHFLVLILALSLNVFSLVIRLSLVVFILVSLRYYIFLYLKPKSTKYVQTIFQDSNQNWFIKTAKYKKQEVILSGSSFLSNILILTNFTDSNKQHYIALITPDSLPKTEYRRLIVRIKMSWISYSAKNLLISAKTVVIIQLTHSTHIRLLKILYLFCIHSPRQKRGDVIRQYRVIIDTDL